LVALFSIAVTERLYARTGAPYNAPSPYSLYLQRQPLVDAAAIITPQNKRRWCATAAAFCRWNNAAPPTITSRMLLLPNDTCCRHLAPRFAGVDRDQTWTTPQNATGEQQGTTVSHRHLPQATWASPVPLALRGTLAVAAILFRVRRTHRATQVHLRAFCISVQTPTAVRVAARCNHLCCAVRGILASSHRGTLRATS